MIVFFQGILAFFEIRSYPLSKMKDNLELIDEIESIQAIVNFLSDVFDLLLNAEGFSISNKTPAGIGLVFQSLYDKLEGIKKVMMQDCGNG